MNLLDKMSLNDAITLYYEKLNALKKGDIQHLILLRRKYPDLFNKEKEAQILDVIQYAKDFQTTQRYKELKRQDIRKRLSIIKDDTTPKK
ncbi:MAG: hypothetical protein ACYC0J_03915 [Gammaproteobacteria bacterium]